MSYLASKPEPVSLMDVFKAFPYTTIPLVDYHEALMRGPSPLTPEEREMIAAYVSALNDCHYCHGIHEKVAEQFGMEAEIVHSLMNNIDEAQISETIKPVLKYVKKLTETPTRITKQDADTIYSAGWDEQALHDAVAICALFNFMNRYVMGLGVEVPEGYLERSSRRIFEEGYKSIKEHL